MKESLAIIPYVKVDIMPGLLPSEVANKMTRASGFMVDWSRVGEFVAKKTMPNYTTKQIMDRVYILAWMGGSAFLSEFLRKAALGEGGPASMVLSISTGLLVGMYYGHKVVLHDKFKDRADNHEGIRELVKTISEKISPLDESEKQGILAIVSDITQYEYKEGAEVKLGASLLHRKKALRSLNMLLDDQIARTQMLNQLRAHVLASLGLKVTEDSHVVAQEKEFTSDMTNAFAH